MADRGHTWRNEEHTHAHAWPNKDGNEIMQIKPVKGRSELKTPLCLCQRSDTIQLYSPDLQLFIIPKITFSFQLLRQLTACSVEVVCSEMLISVWFIWAREPNGGGEKRERAMSCWEINTDTRRPTNTPFSWCHGQRMCCLHTRTHRQTHTWSNWGVVKEAASLISFCLPHCPAALSRASVHRSPSIALCPPAAQLLTLLWGFLCKRENTTSTKKTAADGNKNPSWCALKRTFRSPFDRMHKICVGNPKKGGCKRARQHTGSANVYRCLGKQASGGGGEWGGGINHVRSLLWSDHGL